jgi:hypothetical protein
MTAMAGKTSARFPDLTNAATGLSISRMSEIETRTLARQRIDTLARYVEALGGELVVGLSFEDDLGIVILRDPDRVPRLEPRAGEA